MKLNLLSMKYSEQQWILICKNGCFIMIWAPEKRCSNFFKKILQKVLTIEKTCDKILLVADEVTNMERYRSGHNEAVLKTVCPQGRVGSNPTLSVEGQKGKPRSRI